MIHQVAATPPNIQNGDRLTSYNTYHTYFFI